MVSVLVAIFSAYVSPWGLRQLRLWATQVRADLVSNVVQPGLFSKLEERLTLHIRERLPNGQLLGILIDDQRNPKERVTLLAEKGDLVRNERGAFLVLETGNVQRHETGQRDPALVLFDSYGFDLSWLTNSSQNIKYSARERYLWELYDPDRADTVFADQPNQVRAEFHDRITAPFYPLAFVILTYAYLGAPRTTRQSRTMSLLGAAGAVTALRGLGFVGMIGGVNTPIALLLPYLALGQLRTWVSRDLARRDHRAAGGNHQFHQRDCRASSTRERDHGPIAMIAGTLSRYFGLRFLSAVVSVFAGTLVLTAMIDFLEMMRRSGDIRDISGFFIAKITLFRVPFITERVLPFAVLVGAMYCYLNLSRRLELVVARAAGISAWQFTAPAIVIALLIGGLMITIYNPISAFLREQSTRLEADLFGFDGRLSQRHKRLLDAPAH